MAPTPVRCPVDGTLTALESSVYSESVKAGSHPILAFHVSPSVHLGWWLACGHYVDSGAWELRLAIDDNGRGRTWWGRVGSPTEGIDGIPIPDDAVVVQT